MGDAYASGSDADSPSANDCSSRFAVCEVLRLYDALSGRNPIDGHDCRNREDDHPRHQMTEYKKENALAIGETIAHFATQISPSRRGLRIVPVGDAEMPSRRLVYALHNHSMVAAQMISRGVALPRYCLPVGYPPFCDCRLGRQYDVIR